jgi:hypothetical protein
VLVENGIHPVLARGVAFLAVRAGRRMASESKRRRPVFDAIRFLAKPRQKRAILSRAKILLAAWDETSIIETVFDEVGLQETEFIKLLQAIVQGQTTDLNRLADICTAIAPSLSLDRGPKVSAPSATHKFILESGIKLTEKRLPYSSDPAPAIRSHRLSYPGGPLWRSRPRNPTGAQSNRCEGDGSERNRPPYRCSIAPDSEMKSPTIPS